jgi:quercetin dioxygenase-like cupin family protein
MNVRLTIAAAWTVAAISSALAVAAERQPSETVAPQFQAAIPNVPGKTFTSVIVNFPPGAKSATHRHGEAFVYAYVLSGTIRSQLGNDPAKVYRAGEDWSEPPGALHRVTENMSTSNPAKLLAIFVANTGDPLKTPGQP